MHRAIRLAIASLFYFACLLSQEELESDLPDFSANVAQVQAPVGDIEEGPSFIDAHLTGVPSSIVNQVNVITGTYYDHHVDLVVPGPHPIYIERSYSSSYTRSHWFDDYRTLSNGWGFDHNSAIHLKYVQREKEHGYRVHGETVEGASCMLFETPTTVKKKHEPPEERKLHEMSLSEDVIKHGLTNCFVKEISGRTNIKNHTLEEKLSPKAPKQPRVHYLEQCTGSGAQLTYQKMRHLKKDTDIFLLSKSQAPNGNFLSYQYDQHQHLAKVEAHNRDDKRLGWVNFKPGPMFMIVTANDAQRVTYFFTKRSNRYFLSQVHGPDGYRETFTYEPRTTCNKEHVCQQLIRKEKPDGRYADIHYYHRGSDTVANKHIQLGEEDSRHGRVKRLSAPVGHDQKAVITQQFVYDLKAKKTHVYDANMHLTDYRYDHHDRLKTIVKYNNKNQAYCRDKFFWGTRSADKGNLITHLFSCGKGNLVCRYFCYDSRGNPVEESLYGNLTGRNATSVQVDEEGIPSHEEKYVIKRRYTKDGRNLLIKEIDHRKKTMYGYYPDSDLLERKFIKISGSIYEREFFEYDENRVLIKRIHDDGTSKYKDDLQGVTERHITYIILRQEKPIGLPQEIHEKYLDLETGEELLLSKVVNEHTVRGRLLQQDKYDAHGQCVYSLYWTYDKLGRVIGETNALGENIVRKYDLNNNLIYEKGPAQNRHKEYEYDFANRRISSIDVLADGTRLATKFNYNALNQKVSETDIYGNKRSYRYDALGRLIVEILPPIGKKWASGTLIEETPAPPLRPYDDKVKAMLDARPVVFPKNTFVYNAMGYPIIKRDAMGHATVAAYTVRGKPYKIIYPDRSRELKEYTLEGWLERDTDKKGTVTQFYYDALGRVVCQEVISASGELLKRTQCTYNAFHMLTETDATGCVTEYQYDRAGRLIKTSQGQRVTAQEYDALGRVHKILAYDSLTTFTATIRDYDNLNRVIEESLEDSEGNCLKKETYSYDSDGNRTHVTTHTQAGEATYITLYNAFKQSETIIDACGNVTRVFFNYTYTNELGQHVACEETTDPLGNVTMIIHDTHGHVVSLQRKDLMGELVQQRDFQYDKAGNVVATVETVFSLDGTSHQVTKRCEYDDCNRLIGVVEAEGTPEQTHTQVRYNRQGLKELLIQPNGTSISYDYDALGRLNTFKASDESIHYSYRYDLNDNLIEVIDHVYKSTTQASYDAHNGLISETLGNNLTLHYSYDGQGRLLHITYPDQSQSQYTYRGNLIAAVARQKNEESYRHTYDAYDLAGHPTAATLIGQAGKLQWVYDLMGRTTSIDSSGWSSTLSYDPAGNLADQRIHDLQGTKACQYDYDDLYQLKSEEGNTYQYDSLYNRIAKNGQQHQVNDCNQLISDGISRYSYDANGNLVKKITGEEVVNYAYDAINRLIAVEDATRKTTYRYDANHRRLESHHYVRDDDDDSSWQHQACKRYLYQGDNEIGMCDEHGVIQELRILGLSRGAENGAAIAIELSGNAYAPIHDHNGNVVCLIDSATSQVAESYRYTAFGEEQAASARNPWRFSSKRTDSETGLVYFGNRYYDPTTGRWLTRDPLGNVDGPNLYAFLENNPLCNFDCFGLWGELFESSDPSCPHFGLMDIPMPTTQVYFFESFETQANGVNLFCYNFHYLSSNMSLSGWGAIAWSDFNVPYDPPQEELSRSFSLVDRPFLDHGLGIGWTNGMDTSYDQCTKHAKYLSTMGAGCNIFGIYNATHGSGIDLVESMINLYKGVATGPVHELHRLWNEFLSTSDKPFLQLCHSQGAIHVRNALLSYSPELRKRIIVIGVAPAAYISRDICQECYHYVSQHDFVPWFDIMGRLACSRDIYVLKPDPDADWWDHGFQSKTYEKYIRKHIVKYIKEYGD